jgi:hypothetical protein
MKYFNFLTNIILLLIVISTLRSATIEGIIADSDNSKPLIGANVFIKDCEIGDATDFNGYYQIKNVPLGTNILVVRYFGYREYLKGITISDTNEIIQMNISMEIPFVYRDSISTPEIESYHYKIQETNKTEPVLLINIDTLINNGRCISVEFSMTNNSNDSIYIFKDYPCFNVLDLLVTNYNGEEFGTRNVHFYFDCMGEKTSPDSADMLLIRSGETIKYPKTFTKYLILKSIPEGEYSVQVVYHFSLPQKIYTGFTSHNFRVLRWGIRGRYISSKKRYNVLE